MSSGTEGPGWWQASDGRWYPPHLHPDPARHAADTAASAAAMYAVPDPAATAVTGSTVRPDAATTSVESASAGVDGVNGDEPTLEAPKVTASPRWSTPFDQPVTEVLPNVSPELTETQAHPIADQAPGEQQPAATDLPAPPTPAAWGPPSAPPGGHPVPPPGYPPTGHPPGSYPPVGYPPAVQGSPGYPPVGYGQAGYPPVVYPPHDATGRPQPYAPIPYLPPPGSPESLPPGAQPAGPPTYAPGAPPPGAQIPGGRLPPVGGVPPTPESGGNRGRNWVLAVVALILGVALVGWVVGDLSKDDDGTAIVSGTPFGGGSTGGTGSSSAELDDVIAASLDSIEAFWEDAYPTTFGEPLEPLGGGYHAYTSSGELPPCAESRDQVLNNAFYCYEEDVIAWDTQFFDELAETFGDWAVAIVLAHEWGHVVQVRADMQGQTVTFENQADCYAGAWVARADVGELPAFDGAVRDQAAAGFLVLGDMPGTSTADPMAHGSAFDRLKAFQDGMSNGVDACATYSDATLDLVELPFLSQEDYSRGGDLPFDEVFPTAADDLNDYWSSVAEERFNDDWESLGVQLTDGAHPAGCDGGDGPVARCDGAELSVSTSEAMDSLYSELGDFAPVTILSRYFADVARSAYEFPESGLPDDTTRNDCLSGAWTRSVYEQDRATSEGGFALSPGDIDEAVGALLLWPVLSGHSTEVTGFDSVAAFSAGLSDGIAAC